MAVLISNEPSRTFNEFRFFPNWKGPKHRPENVDLTTPLVKYHRKNGPSLKLNIPFTSAIMQAVSGPKLAIALARCGGLSFIYQSQPIEEQVAMVKEVKTWKTGFPGKVSDSNLKPDDTVHDALELRKKTGHTTIAITADGSPTGKLLGMLTSRDIRPDQYDPNQRVEVLMTPLSKLDYCPQDISLEQANDVIWHCKLNALPIVDDEGHLLYFVFRTDFDEHQANPRELVDEQKRLMVGAGINTRDYRKRVPALIDAGADILCVDSSNGFTCWQDRTIRWIKKKYGEVVKVGGGNVVDKLGFLFLVNAGADFVKIGIGGGSICITSEQKGLGRGQATAVMEIAKTRDIFYKEFGTYIPLCSDGNIVLVHHMSLAQAMGADFVMMGGWLARFDEAPGPLVPVAGKYMKEYWGEGTNRARNLNRYEQAAKIKNDQRIFAYEEGIEGYVPYAGKLKDNIEGAEGVEGALPKIRDIMCDSGALNFEQFHKKARLDFLSQAAIKAGQVNVLAKTGVA